MYRTHAATSLCAFFLVSSASARESSGDLPNQLDTQLQINREHCGMAGQAVLAAHNGKVLYQVASDER